MDQGDISMTNNYKIQKILWIVIAAFSLLAAISGVLKPDLYGKVISSDFLPGIIAQDLTTIISGLLLLYLGFRTGAADFKKQIVAVSLVGYSFYGYAIYAIERVYTPLYLVYLAVTALSFWCIVYFTIQIKRETVLQITAPKLIRYLSAGCLFITAALFYSLWTTSLLPLMRAGEKIEYLYSIYILDMVFILPAVILCAVLLIKRNPFGLIFSPILFLKAFTLLFSVGLGGLAKPFFGAAANIGETAFYLFLSAIYLAFAVLILWKTDFQEQAD
jgi:hypothetical protein